MRVREKRIAAAVADPGVVRVADSWEAHLPDAMVDLLDNKDKATFDEFLVAGHRDKPAELAELRWRMAPYAGVTRMFFDASRRPVRPRALAMVSPPSLLAYHLGVGQAAGGD